MKAIKTAWNWLINFLEYGDLVPLLVLVSAYHYAAILRNKDAPVVAIAIGLLVDLGHFRTIRAAFRYDGSDNWHKAKLWLIALAMTGVSLAYHQRYYGDFWLSAPIPFLIAALAWLKKVDKPTGSRPKAETSQPQQLTKLPDSKPEPLYLCACGYEARSLAALNGHKRKHSAKLADRVANVPLNGNGKAHQEKL